MKITIMRNNVAVTKTIRTTQFVLTPKRVLMYLDETGTIKHIKLKPNEGLEVKYE